jgi:hypothetical protein
MIEELQKAKGTVELVLTSADGDVKETHVSNTIVNGGKAFLIGRMLSGASDAFTYHIGLGNGATAVAVTQTDIITPVGARVPSETPAIITSTVNSDTLQLVATFGVTEVDLTVQEAGLFTALTAGTMLARTTFGSITKAPADTLTITWKIQQT